MAAFGAGMQARAQDPDEKTDPDEAREAYFARMEAEILASLSDPELPAMGYTPCVGGSAGGYACSGVDLMAYLPHGSIGGGTGNDIWGWTDPLDGREYAVIGQSNGTAFVDVTVPANPVYLGKLPTHTSNSTWRDIKVYKNRAFIVSEAPGHGMQVFDLRRLRSVPFPPQTFTEDAHYGGFGDAHNIAINEATGYAYVVGASSCAGGLTFINISNPNTPFGAGCFSSDGYTHDVQCVIYSGPDAQYQGDEICFAYNEDTLTIVNVSSKANPYQISRKTYSGARYTHQGWLTEDQAYLLLGDEMDETTFGHNTRTRIWDVSNLDSPFVKGIYDGPNASTDHNLYIDEGFAFEANYSSGLQILKLSNIGSGSLSMVGYFDTYQPHNSTGILGAWSVYPFFDSGTVVVNGIGEGLFVLSPRILPDFKLTTSTTRLNTCLSGADSTMVNVSGMNGYIGTVQLSTAGLPAGSSAVFSPASVAVPGNSSLTVTVNGTYNGSYPFAVSGNDGNIQRSTFMTLRVFGAFPGSVSLVSPAYGAAGVPLQPAFKWNPAAETSSYYIEISLDPEFTNIVHSATTTGTGYTPGTSLANNTKYFWRVTPQNPCGNGAVSGFSYFRTESSYCRAVNLSIPDDDSAGVTDTFVVGGSGTIIDLDLSVDAVHTWVGDLKFSLTHQGSGTSATVINRPGVPASSLGCSGDDIDATLDDEAALPVENVCSSGTPTIQGTYSPNGPLSVFDGKNINGTWKLTVSDHSQFDTGSLTGWCLGAEIQLPPVADIYISPSSVHVAQPEGMTTNQNLSIANTGSTGLNWTVSESSGSCASPVDIPWLSASPISGTTAPAAVQTVKLSLNSSGLPEGNHTANLCIGSNDPDAGMVTVPVILKVVNALYDVYLPVISR